MTNSKLATFIVIIAILVLAGTIIYFKGGFTGYVVNNPVSADAAKWIGQHSTVYVQDGCSHCIDQENLFGANWEYMNVIDYQKDPQAFIDNNITGTPTWVINGQQYVGYQSIATLENLTGYQG
jgi:glutaredoxin